MQNFGIAYLNYLHLHTYTDSPIYAPESGSLVLVKFRPGAWVNAGQQVFSLIEENSWWIIANFKETNLERIKLGMRCDINLAMYTKHTFKGYVGKISRGSGAAFSVLPPQNTSGNFVKIVRRFPVTVYFTATNFKQYPLRVGASATVTVKIEESKVHVDA